MTSDEFRLVMTQIPPLTPIGHSRNLDHFESEFLIGYKSGRVNVLQSQERNVPRSGQNSLRRILIGFGGKNKIHIVRKLNMS